MCHQRPILRYIWPCLAALCLCGLGCTVMLPAIATSVANHWTVKSPSQLGGLQPGRSITIGLRAGEVMEGKFRGYRLTDASDPPASAAASNVDLTAGSVPVAADTTAAPDSAKAIALWTDSGLRVIPVADVSWVRVRSSAATLVPFAVVGFLLDYSVFRSVQNGFRGLD